MLKIDPSMQPTKGNVEHREVCGYDLMERVISEVGTNYDLSICKTKARTILD